MNRYIVAVALCYGGDIPNPTLRACCPRLTASLSGRQQDPDCQTSLTHPVCQLERVPLYQSDHAGTQQSAPTFVLDTRGSLALGPSRKQSNASPCVAHSQAAHWRDHLVRRPQPSTAS